MATKHCSLRDKHGDLQNATDSVLYGPSTDNKIETEVAEGTIRQNG